jgi:hypothetical protein
MLLLLLFAIFDQSEKTKKISLGYSFKTTLMAKYSISVFVFKYFQEYSF